MIRHILSAVVILPLLAAAAAAQQPREGVLVTLVRGQQLAREQFRITEADGRIARIDSEIRVRGAVQRAVTERLADGELSFQVEVGGTPAIAAVLDPGAGRVRVTLPKESETASSARVFLENIVWQHYYFLLESYAAAGGGEQDIAVFLPSVGMTLSVRLSRGEPRSVDWEGGALELVPYSLRPAVGPPLDLWTNTAGDPLFIEVASQRVRVHREGFEALGEIVGQPAEPKTGETSNPAIRAEEVRFHNGEQRLVGTLSRPGTGDGPWPAVLLISGSGPQDRDGTPGADGVYRQIAEFLSERGLVVLRHDDRGAGESSLPTGPTSYRDVVNDSRAGLEFLRQRPESDGRLIVIGHSEGALTAAILGAEEEGIGAVVSLAGASIPLDQVARQQAVYQGALSQLVDPATDAWMNPVSRRILQMSAEAREGGRDRLITDLNEYWRQHQQISPTDTIAAVQAPVLILQGARDLQVMPSHAIALAEAAGRSNPDVRLRIFAELGHLLKDGDGQVAAAVLEVLHKWLAEVVPG